MTSETQTAMLLTEQEWEDLAFMVRQFQKSHDRPPNNTAHMQRRVDLAQRIIQAVED